MSISTSSPTDEFGTAGFKLNLRKIPDNETHTLITTILNHDLNVNETTLRIIDSRVEARGILFTE